MTSSGSGAVDSINAQYAPTVNECATAAAGDSTALRHAAEVMRSVSLDAGRSEEYVREDVGRLTNWTGRTQQTFTQGVTMELGNLQQTFTSASTCADAMEMLANAMRQASWKTYYTKTKFEWIARALSWIASVPGINEAEIAGIARRNGENAAAASKQAVDELEQRLAEFVATVRGAVGGSTGVGNHADPPGWQQQYTSPNTHPDVVGTRRVGGNDVPRYDMTGHEPPANRPAGDLNQWITEAKQVLAANGVDTSTMTDADLRALIRHESGGDPLALNDWDRNARHGIPSKGLMQTIDQTFNTFSVEGHRDVWNPVDNIVAGVRYGIDRYGSFDNIPGIRRLHQGQDYIGY